SSLVACIVHSQCQSGALRTCPAHSLARVLFFSERFDTLLGMRPFSALTLLALVLGASSLAAAPRQHVITFGKSTPVKWFVSPQQTLDMSIRSLLVDGKLREFTTGDAHDVTDRTFVVRRAFRVNDTLPEEADRKRPPRWKWQRGGWLQVDRQT